MKSHPRIRKTIKWGGAAVTVMLAVVWIFGACTYFVCFCKAGAYISMSRGQFCVMRCTPDSNLVHREDNLRWLPLPIQWNFYWSHSPAKAFTSSWTLAVPLWAPVALVLPVTVFAWRLDTLARRRARLNLCPKCNYDRAGLASKDAKCPECGAAPAGV